MNFNPDADPIIAFSELSEALSTLSPRQIADAESLPIEKRRAERKAVYSLINRFIYPGLLLSHQPDGAPLLQFPDSAPFPGHFSLSHCRTAAAIAYSTNCPIGIDIEDASPRLNRIADKFLSEKEKQLLSPLTDKKLLAAWTFKEAAFKSLGDRQLVLSAIIIENISDDGLSIEMRASSLAGKTEGRVTFSTDSRRALAVAKIK